MNDRLNHGSIELLFRTILALETLEECADLFEDLCTMSELKSISQRVIVAKMLHNKRVYSEIIRETNASTATISRVNRSLVYGNNGFQKVFARLPQHFVDTEVAGD